MTLHITHFFAAQDDAPAQAETENPWVQAWARLGDPFRQFVVLMVALLLCSFLMPLGMYLMNGIADFGMGG